MSSSSRNSRGPKSSLLRPSRNNGGGGHLVSRLLGRELGLSSYSATNNQLLKRGSNRPAFLLRDVVPLRALQQGHVFLGFSRCGRFLLSYTQSSDVEVTAELLTLNYHYRLHWWLFVPYQRATIVSEIGLFTKEGVPATLRIGFCEWPRDMTKVAIYGWSTGSAVEMVHDSRPCYLTITSVPSLHNCKMCRQVRTSCRRSSDDSVEEDITHRIEDTSSCAQHSLTMHTFFELVQPFPSFNPSISMKRNSHVVINSGNILSALSLNLEKKHTVLTNDRVLPTENQAVRAMKRQRSLAARRPSIIWNTRNESVKDNVNSSAKCSKVYELTEEEFLDTRASLNTFPFYRKQRLAEKRYEFREDEENVTASLPHKESTNGQMDEMNKHVLRTLQYVNCSVTEDQQQTENQNIGNARGARRKQQLPRFHTNISTYFVAPKQITEEEEAATLNPTIAGFHLALPLEVLGEAQLPMTAVGNIETLNNDCDLAIVRQSSLDLEQLCHYVALKKCREIGIYCSFFIDFDVMLVDVDNMDGDVLCVAVVLVKPEGSFTKPNECLQYEARFRFKWNTDTGQVTIVGVDDLKQVSTKSQPQGLWHPAKAEAAALQRQLSAMNSGGFGVRSLTNDSVLRGRSLKVITDEQMLVTILLDDLEGHDWP